MTYEEFIQANRSKLLGYHLLAELSKEFDILSTPYPPESLTEEQVEMLKHMIKECIPKDSMIVDLWDWDIHFEESLGDDWVYEAVFGAASSLNACAEKLGDFFLEKADEHGMDYNQDPDDPGFENLVKESAAWFLVGWRENLCARYAR